MSFSADAAEAQHGVLAGVEALLELLEVGALHLPVGDVRLDPVALGHGLGELAQAPHPLGEHQPLLLTRDPGECLGDDPAQQW